MRVYDWARIQCYHDAGHDRDACMRRFGFAIASWYKALRERKIIATPLRFFFDWEAVQVYYDKGHTYAECREKFGFSAGSWSKRVRLGTIVTRSKRFTLQRILTQSISRASIKRRLMEAGILKNKCDECGIMDWHGKPLSIQLHHSNGIRNDHRFENLRMLCPNCHSQTSTFGTRNRKRLAVQSRRKLTLVRPEGYNS